MIIGITGYGATGASACIDLLKEFDEIQSYRSGFEFQLLQQPDGICDMKYYLTNAGRRLSTICSLRRFEKNISNPRNFHINRVTGGKYKALTQEYFDALVQLSWNGKSSYDPVDMQSILNAMWLRRPNRALHRLLARVNKDWTWPPAQKRNFSFLNEEEFNQITTKYLYAVLESCGFSMEKPLMLEQIFDTASPTEGMEYFQDARSIIVDRDPRDVFIITNVTLKSFCGFMPNSGNVEDFVTYYRALHKTRSQDPRVMYLQYEDLIYDYESTIAALAEFTGLDHVKKGVYFKPQCSINNTQQYLNHPEVRSSIEYIEEHLADLLYPFEEKKDNIHFTPIKMKSFEQQSDADKKLK